jgi:hypothetical protein
MRQPNSNTLRNKARPTTFEGYQVWEVLIKRAYFCNPIQICEG